MEAKKDWQKTKNWRLKWKHFLGFYKQIKIYHKILRKNYVYNRMMKLEVKIENLKQKYLHLAIEVRPYLWT